jgi:DNA-directed RNA polymerase subunit RPC12/RpoP
VSVLQEENEMTDFKFQCPHCEQSLEVPQDMLGETIDCPTCNKRIQLPSPQRSSPAVSKHDNRPACPKCGGPVGILPPNEANFEEFPPGWDALGIIICNPLIGPFAFLTQPWFCRKCKEVIPKDKIPAEFRRRRTQVGCSFFFIGLVVFAIAIILIGVLGD